MHGSKFDFRAAEITDIDTMFDLYVEVQTIHANAEPEFCRKPQRDEIFEQFFEGILKDPDQHLVFACAGSAVAGFCQYFMGTQHGGLSRRERQIAFVNGLVISENFRRQGCGTALLEFVKGEAKKQGIASVGIDVWSFNTAAKACFSHAGFKVKQEYMWLNL